MLHIWDIHQCQLYHASYMCERCDTPIYNLVHCINVSVIKIDITDGMGRRLPFQEGETIVILYLRNKYSTFSDGLSTILRKSSGYGQSIYTGSRYQRGHVLGTLQDTRLMTVAPMLQKTTVSLGKDALRYGVISNSQSLTDIVAGVPVKNLSNYAMWMKVDI